MTSLTQRALVWLWPKELDQHGPAIASSLDEVWHVWHEIDITAFRTVWVSGL